MLVDYIKMKFLSVLNLFAPIDPVIVHVESSGEITLSRDEYIDLIFTAVHNANSVLKKLNKEKVEDISEVSEERKASIKKAILDTLNGESLTPKESHDKWLKAHKEMGYKYGTKINHEKKLHPCMVPYSKLPVLQKAKDEMFQTVINTFKEKLR